MLPRDSLDLFVQPVDILRGIGDRYTKDSRTPRTWQNGEASKLEAERSKPRHSCLELERHFPQTLLIGVP